METISVIFNELFCQGFQSVFFMILLSLCLLVLIVEYRENKAKKYIRKHIPEHMRQYIICGRCGGDHFDTEMQCQDCSLFDFDSWGIDVAKRNIEKYKNLHESNNN